jgi:SAM-dependent methyltransferase
LSDLYLPEQQPGTDRENLMKHAYADERNLEIRTRTHEQYTVPQHDFFDWVLSQHHFWRGDEWVLDAGCGRGNYFDSVLARLNDEARYFAGDFSSGMVRRAAQHELANYIDFAVEDLQAIPFPDNTFDVVMANHVLYHVPDLDLALSEIHRVLRPDGVLLSAVNSQFTMVEFNTLTRRAYTLLGHPDTEEPDNMISFDGFTLENASVKLARVFRGVARYEIPSALIFDEVDPVVDYLDSMRALRESSLPPGIAWEDFMMIMRNQIERLISHFGELVVNKLSGVLIATEKGGFAAEYFALYDELVG